MRKRRDEEKEMANVSAHKISFNLHHIDYLRCFDFWFVHIDRHFVSSTFVSLCFALRSRCVHHLLKIYTQFCVLCMNLCFTCGFYITCVSIVCDAHTHTYTHASSLVTCLHAYVWNRISDYEICILSMTESTLSENEICRPTNPNHSRKMFHRQSITL